MRNEKNGSIHHQIKYTAKQLYITISRQMQITHLQNDNRIRFKVTL